MTVAEKIKALRKRAKLTQTELGQKLGVQKNAVSKWECGRVEEIPSSKIKAMASLFGVQPSYLIDDDQTAAPIEILSNTISPIQDGSPIHLSISDTDPQIDAILRNARKLNAQGLERLEAYSDDLAGNPKYLKQKAPLTIAARGGRVMDVAQIDVDVLDRGLDELDAEDNL